MAEKFLSEEEIREERNSPSKVSLKRLNRKDCVEKVYKLGRRRTTRYFTLFYLANDTRECRFAVHLSKRFGIAVRRNHIKRVFRGLLNRIKGALDGCDIIVIPRKGSDKLGVNKVCLSFEREMIDASILKKR